MFLCLCENAYHDFILTTNITEYVLFPRKHNDYDFCQINEKHSIFYCGNIIIMILKTHNSYSFKNHNIFIILFGIFFSSDFM